jgi:hypothetical protein
MPENDKQIVTKDGTSPQDSPLTIENRNDWNTYLDWLKENKLHGHPDLNKGEGEDNTGNKVLQAYIQAVKDGKAVVGGKPVKQTTLSVDLVPHIQKDFANVKKYYQDEIKAGRLSYDTKNGGNEKNFMSNISDVDGLAGTKTTSIPFPPKYIQTLNTQGKVTGVENAGLNTQNVGQLIK